MLPPGSAPDMSVLQIICTTRQRGVLLVKESSGKSNLVMKVAGLPSPIFLGHLGRMKSKLFEEKVQYITYDKTMQFHLSKG